jgi:hypothetical protein
MAPLFHIKQFCHVIPFTAFVKVSIGKVAWHCHIGFALYEVNLWLVVNDGEGVRKSIAVNPLLPLQLIHLWWFPFFKTGSPAKHCCQTNLGTDGGFLTYFLCIFCIRREANFLLNHLQLKHLLSYCEKDL